MNTIVVATTPGREKWLDQCLKSIGDIPTVVLSDFTFELGKIKWMYENTNVDRFLFLQDSVVVKDKKFFDLIFSYPKSVAVSPCPTVFGMYLGIYSRDTLSQIEIPKVNNKDEAIYYEMEWSNKYCSIEKVPVLFPDFIDHNNKGVIEKFGRPNLILENDYLIKFKGTWFSRVQGGGPPETFMGKKVATFRRK